ncbi:MAG: aminopeptidase, partial [Negativicutes bacterium]|nr:aminopeptidase [Negativicutes bacterium]
CYQLGGIPYVSVKSAQLMRNLLRGCSPGQLEDIARWEADRMQTMQAYIGIRGSYNNCEMSDVDDEKLQLYQRHWMKPVHAEIRVKKTKWCVMRYPTESMAQAAGMSTEKFTDFYFDVCCLDYSKMSRAMDELVARMERTDRVRITGPATDLQFSIKGMKAVKCDGKLNIPDGEVFTAPVKDSVNGHVTFNTPSPFQGTIYENIRLEFVGGRIVSATANYTDKLNKVLDTDEGARYIGEFALGLNPGVTQPMKEILFDEKIDGSFHFTPGQAYDEADNGNRSAVHWDMVMIQTPGWGGGEIWFDDELIRKDGRFVPEYLSCLNPENLR